VGGIVIYPDSGGSIINYPEQHIRNGRQKNMETNAYFKKMVRIIKKMRHLMDDLNIASASNVSSFGVESLVWNVPNHVFLEYRYNYRFIFDNIVSYLYRNTAIIGSFKEANGIKPLCPTQADTDKYTLFVQSLRTFFEYVD